MGIPKFSTLLSPSSKIHKVSLFVVAVRLPVKLQGNYSPVLIPCILIFSYRTVFDWSRVYISNTNQLIPVLRS